LPKPIKPREIEHKFQRFTTSSMSGKDKKKTDETPSMQIKKIAPTPETIRLFQRVFDEGVIPRDSSKRFDSSKLTTATASKDGKVILTSNVYKTDGVNITYCAHASGDVKYPTINNLVAFVNGAEVTREKWVC
jgi:hypothetical protein